MSSCHVLNFRNNCPTALNITYPFVFFGFKDSIQDFLKNQNFVDTTEDVDGIFVPLDGSVPPGKYFIIKKVPESYTSQSHPRSYILCCIDRQCDSLISTYTITK